MEQARQEAVQDALLQAAMSAAARRVYEVLRTEGTQKNLLDAMQTRAELYKMLRYLDYERQFDELSAEKERS